MAYRHTKKRGKLWSERANAKQARDRMAGDIEPIYDEVDKTIIIDIERPGTGEKAHFQLLEGNRIDNYSVYCNGKHLGIMGITRVMSGIRKALPSYRRIN